MSRYKVPKNVVVPKAVCWAVYRHGTGLSDRNRRKSLKGLALCNATLYTQEDSARYDQNGNQSAENGVVVTEYWRIPMEQGKTVADYQRLLKCYGIHDVNATYKGSCGTVGIHGAGASTQAAADNAARKRKTLPERFYQANKPALERKLWDYQQELRLGAPVEKFGKGKNKPLPKHVRETMNEPTNVGELVEPVVKRMLALSDWMDVCEATRVAVQADDTSWFRWNERLNEAYAEYRKLQNVYLRLTGQEEKHKEAVPVVKPNPQPVFDNYVSGGSRGFTGKTIVIG